MHCIKCDEETKNPKFCSRSCAASHNNTIKPKRSRSPAVCAGCANPFFKRNSTNQVFCSKECRRITRNKAIKTAGRFDINGQPSSNTVRKYIATTVGNNCFVCGQSGDDWRGRQLTLIVDHIDGDAHNWAISNIQLVCPNCDSQLPTFKGRNKGKSTRKYTIIQR